ncbi:restriction endonuclease subunit S, partial [Eggerthella lenta]
MTAYRIGDICTFVKGASIPRDRMHNDGEYLYLHYGDLYRGHELYIDIKNPQKKLPYIQKTEQIKDEQYVCDGDIVYILTSETVEDLGKALLLKNPDQLTVVSGTETTVMRVKDRQVLIPAYLNYLIQTPFFKRTLRQYVTGMKVVTRKTKRNAAKVNATLR